MIKQLVIPFAAVAVFIVAVGLFVKNSDSINLSALLTPATSGNPSSKTIKLSDKSINIEIANSKDLRAKGLSGRSNLDANSGMLFVFDSKPASPSPIFWMKDMLIPLDMIWISGNNIVQIDKNIAAPPAHTPDSKLDIISPTGPIDYVLEVNAGFSDKNNIKVGDPVVLPTL